MNLESAIANDVILSSLLPNDPLNFESGIKPRIEISYELAKVVEFDTELILEEFTV